MAEGGTQLTSRTAHGARGRASLPEHAVTGRLALAAIGGAVLAIAGNALVLLVDPHVPADAMSYPLSPGTFRFGQIFFALTQALMSLGMIALARTPLSRRTRSSKVGAGLAVVGFVITVPGELALALVADAVIDSTRASAASSVFGVGIVLADAGLIVFGVSALRARPRRRLAAALPLVFGVFQLGVVTPVSFAAGFASTAAFMVITAPDLLVVLLGIVIMRRGLDDRGGPQPERPLGDREATGLTEQDAGPDAAST